MGITHEILKELFVDALDVLGRLSVGEDDIQWTNSDTEVTCEDCGCDIVIGGDLVVHLDKIKDTESNYCSDCRYLLIEKLVLKSTSEELEAAELEIQEYMDDIEFMLYPNGRDDESDQELNDSSFLYEDVDDVYDTNFDWYELEDDDL